MQMVATTIRRPAPSFVKRFTKYPPFLSSIINLHSRSPFMIPLPLVDDLLRTSLIHCDHNTGMKTSLSNIYMSFHCEFTILKFCDSGPNITTTKNLYLRRWGSQWNCLDISYVFQWYSYPSFVLYSGKLAKVSLKSDWIRHILPPFLSCQTWRARGKYPIPFDPFVPRRAPQRKFIMADPLRCQRVRALYHFYFLCDQSIGVLSFLRIGVHKGRKHSYRVLESIKDNAARK